MNIAHVYAIASLAQVFFAEAVIRTYVCSEALILLVFVQEIVDVNSLLSETDATTFESSLLQTSDRRLGSQLINWTLYRLNHYFARSHPKTKWHLRKNP